MKKIVAIALTLMMLCGAVTVLALILILAAALVLRGNGLKAARRTKVSGS